MKFKNGLPKLNCKNCKRNDGNKFLKTNLIKKNIFGGSMGSPKTEKLKVEYQQPL